MKDLDLIKILRGRLLEAAAMASWPYPVLQRPQPTQQGQQEVDVNNGGAIYFQKLFDVDYGFPGTYTSPYDETRNKETTKQRKETTFEISANVIQNPSDTSIPTASDVVNYLAAVLKRRDTMRDWSQKGIGILRFSKISNDYFEDDRHRLQANPKFELVVTWTQETEILVPVNVANNLSMYGV